MESDSLMGEVKETTIALFEIRKQKVGLREFVGISSHSWVERKMKN